MTVAAPPKTLLTAEEYVSLPDDGRRTELFRGQVVEIPMPPAKHGFYCMNLGRHVGNFVKDNDLGRVASNDLWVKTERGPDTVRGADIAYWSYDRLPRGAVPDGLIPTAPELVIEVRSPSERWNKVFRKVGEYLEAGVQVVCILDPRSETLIVYRMDELAQTLTVDDELTLPDVLPGFRIKVGEFYA
jgi:Uma2 family endonuclease